MEHSTIPHLTPSPTIDFKHARVRLIIEVLREFFASRGIDAYLVGGLVRDAALGRTSRDIDLAVAGDALRIGRELADRMGGSFVLLDDGRCIARVALPDGGGTRFVDINPARDGILADLDRRDFTIDAMAVSLENTLGGLSSQAVIDPHGGLADLRASVIRAIKPAVFMDDPARLARAPRLAAQLQLSIDSNTAAQIRRDAHLLATVAPERVRDELLKLLAEPGAMDSVRSLDALGLLCEIIPELADAKDVTQPKEHYWDVFNHLVETVGQVERIVQGQPAGGDHVVDTLPRFEDMDERFAEEVGDGHTRLTLLKLAGLLHDIAKPATRTVEATGRIRFLGHHSEGERMTRRILERLRFSKRSVRLLALMTRHHLRPGQMAREGELPTRRAIFRYFRDAGDAAIDTLYLNMADYLSARGAMLDEHEWSHYRAAIDAILCQGLEGKSPKILPKLIDGHDIMEKFALTPGPRVGELLASVTEACASGEIETREEALRLVSSRLRSGEDIA